MDVCLDGFSLLLLQLILSLCLSDGLSKLEYIDVCVYASVQWNSELMMMMMKKKEKKDYTCFPRVVVVVIP